MFGKAIRGARGHIVLTHEDGARTEMETRQCAHCGAHWLYVPRPDEAQPYEVCQAHGGFGPKHHSPKGCRVRSFCQKCNGMTCGAEKCLPCLPYEAQIEIMEGPKKGQAARKYLEEYEKEFGPLK